MAKIIKSGGKRDDAGPKRHVADVLPDSGGVVHKRVMDAGARAEKILADAEDEAARIRKEAQEVLGGAMAAREDAVRKGYAEGESKGLAKVTEKLMHVEKIKEQFYDQAEPEIIKLVLSIAEKVIGRVATENEQAVRSVVRQALEKAIGDRVTVRLNPSDYKAILAGEHEFKDVIDRTKRLMFREDEAIAKGGCVVETEVGTIDAQIETQLEAIRKALVS